jgi:pyruvate dehydrogenase E2 component (dihydrolipoamide acetyltransferase)
MSISRIAVVAASAIMISALARAEDAAKPAAPAAAPAAATAPDAAAPPAATPTATAEIPAASPCAEDVEVFCKGVKGGEGDILRCLGDKSGEISSACKGRLDRLKKDFLASAADCEPDVQAFCATVPHSGGRVMQCLKKHEKELSAPCRALQGKLKDTAHAPHAAMPAKHPAAAAPGETPATAASSVAPTPAAVGAPAAAGAPAADPTAPAK